MGLDLYFQIQIGNKEIRNIEMILTIKLVGVGMRRRRFDILSLQSNLISTEFQEVFFIRSHIGSFSILEFYIARDLPILKHLSLLLGIVQKMNSTIFVNHSLFKLLPIHLFAFGIVTKPIVFPSLFIPIGRFLTDNTGSSHSTSLSIVE